MSVLRVAVSAITVAAAVARHPVVRAGLRAAPRLITPQMKQKAADATLDAAYNAGVAVRKLIRGSRQ
ncbi:MAG TPA: hypothetical protein VIN06_08700 [Devosia sp.]